jgi:hypothetical protein
MNPLFLVPVFLLLAGVSFMIIGNKKHKMAKSGINFDLERSKYDQYKQELLTKDFAQLKQWMKGKSIDAFTSASVPQSTSSKAQEFISNGVKNVALSAISVKLKTIETDCFWVLSGSDLHFFSTDTAGELDEHIVFDNFRIENATLHYSGIVKTQFAIYLKSHDDYLPKAHVITFNIDGSPLALQIHDRLNYMPKPIDALNMKKQLETRTKYQIVGERFVGILQDKFPNLVVA